MWGTPKMEVRGWGGGLNVFLVTGESGSMAEEEFGRWRVQQIHKEGSCTTFAAQRTRHFVDEYVQET